MNARGSQDVGNAEAYRLAGLGATFAAAIVAFALGGWLLDRWLGTTPLFTIGGTVLGAVAGFLKIYLAVREDVIRRKQRRSERGP